eukprot:5623989-Pyramimonas_sp.AAC.2
MVIASARRSCDNLSCHSAIPCPMSEANATHTHTEYLKCRAFMRKAGYMRAVLPVVSQGMSLWAC